MTKILNLLGSTLSPAARDLLETIASVEDGTPDARSVSAQLDTVDVLLTGLDLKIDATMLAHASNLRIIATPTTGLDHIDLEEAKKQGITVLNLRGEDDFLKTITPTAELAFGLMLNLLRHIVPASQAVRRGEWNREQFRGHSLKGLTLGIVGMGRLGSMMAHYGTAFGMRVLGTDPAVTSDGTWEHTTLDQLLSKSDVVSLHVHLSPETESLIDMRALNRMKPTAILINTSRGKIVDEPAVIMQLRKNKLGGYGADVLVGELQGDLSAHPLVQFSRDDSRVLLTPHIGGMTEEARAATDMCIAQKILTTLQRGDHVNKQ